VERSKSKAQNSRKFQIANIKTRSGTSKRTPGVLKDAEMLKIQKAEMKTPDFNREIAKAANKTGILTTDGTDDTEGKFQNPKSKIQGNSKFQGSRVKPRGLALAMNSILRPESKRCIPKLLVRPGREETWEISASSPRPSPPLKHGGEGEDGVAARFHLIPSRRSSMGCAARFLPKRGPSPAAAAATTTAAAGRASAASAAGTR
jgi:hypothetical protein